MGREGEGEGGGRELLPSLKLMYVNVEVLLCVFTGRAIGVLCKLVVDLLVSVTR